MLQLIYLSRIPKSAFGALLFYVLLCSAGIINLVRCPVYQTVSFPSVQCLILFDVSFLNPCRLMHNGLAHVLKFISRHASHTKSANAPALVSVSPSSRMRPSRRSASQSHESE